MTIAQAIARLNALKPHEYPEDAIIAWLADVEQLIINEVIAGHWPRRKPHRPHCKPRPQENPLEQDKPAEDDADTDEPTEDERPKWPPERYTTATPGDTVLVVPDPYSELYVHYLSAQIDYSNGEMSRYANSLSMFRAALDEFSNRFNRTHMPVQKAYVRI